METDEQRSLRGFVGLVERLLSRELSPGDFEHEFFRLWGQDRTTRPPELFAVMERFFFVVEDYVDDPDLRDADDVDEDGLRSGAQRFLDEVSALQAS
jgi:self-protective colicin-like immunity protein